MDISEYEIVMFSEFVLYFFAFIFGAVIASFINSLVSRLPSLKKSTWADRSHCDYCKKTLLWWELFPVLSWVFLRGRCSKCCKPVSLLHPVSELVLGLLFLLTTYVCLSGSIEFGLWCLGILVVLFFFSSYDIQKGLVPNYAIVPVIAAVLILRVVLRFFDASPLAYLAEYLVAAVLYSGLFFLINFISSKGLFPGIKKKQGFGWGDSKYALFLGLLLGLRGTLVAGWTAIFAGGFFGVILIIVYRAKALAWKNLKLPYVPFMSLGAWVAMMWGQQIVDFLRRYLWI